MKKTLRRVLCKVVGITEPPGCEEEGVIAYACVRDGFRETRALEALPVPGATVPVADIILVGANIGFIALFLLLFLPYVVCLRYIEKRRGAVSRRDELRKKVEEYYDFK